MLVYNTWSSLPSVERPMLMSCVVSEWAAARQASQAEMRAWLWYCSQFIPVWLEQEEEGRAGAGSGQRGLLWCGSWRDRLVNGV